MFRLKHVVAALTLGTALLMSPLAADAVVTHHTASAKHLISHKKKKHRRVHRKIRHTHKSVALHARVKPHALHTVAAKSTRLISTAKHTKAVSTKTGSRHHPNL